MYTLNNINNPFIIENFTIINQLRIFGLQYRVHNKIKPLSSFIDVNSSLYRNLFIFRISLTKSIPSEWTSVLKNESHLLNIETDEDRDMNFCLKK